MMAAMTGQPSEMAIGPAVVPAEVEGREAARQDRDDRERDGEVGEPAPGPVELLLVSEIRQQLFVGVQSLLI
jgi:hypothetical protein